MRVNYPYLNDSIFIDKLTSSHSLEQCIKITALN